MPRPISLKLGRLARGSRGALPLPARLRLRAGPGRPALPLDLGDALLERLHEVDDRRLGDGLGPPDLLARELRLEHRPQLAPVLVLELGGVELADEALDHLPRELELGPLHLGALDRLLDLGARAYVLGEEERLEREPLAVRPAEAQVLLAPEHELADRGHPALDQLLRLDVALVQRAVALVLDRRPALAVERAEGDVRALGRDGEPDRDVDQAEADGAVPDRPHGRLSSLVGPALFFPKGAFPSELSFGQG